MKKSRSNRPQIFPRKKFIFRCRDYRLDLGQKTKIMGIVNVTPDSFSGDGRRTQTAAVRLAKKLIKEGADIIDVGGESSRPGASAISVKEELKRVIPVVKTLAKNTIPISIDTYKPEVATAALAAGASIVNNIRGTTLNKSLLKIVKKYNAGIILMHMRGTPKTMQKKISYHNLLSDIIGPLRKSIEICLEIGIKSDRIIIDPGIGFGKTAEQNLEIINRLPEFQTLNTPILIGTSRKSFIGKILKQDVHRRLMGTAATVTTGILKGAHIMRVHDVKAIAQTVKVTDAIINQKMTLHNNYK